MLFGKEEQNKTKTNQKKKKKKKIKKRKCIHMLRKLTLHASGNISLGTRPTSMPRNITERYVIKPPTKIILFSLGLDIFIIL